ncbi:MAG: flavodoxin [Lachnospiraceae bacterium]
MSKVTIAYWSGTGNTEEMAKLIAKGVEEGGAEAVLQEIEEISAADLKDEAIIALGCPSMGDEVLEETIVEPFVSDLEGSLGGKKVALFGSYGWGDGEWMRDWENRVKDAGAVLIQDAGLIANEAPDDEASEKCIELGKALASA